jgi:uncharacterized membrane protein required for colicin V production
MTLPAIGFISIPDCVFAAYLLYMLFAGFLRGPGRELGSLACALAALLLSIAPPVHNLAVETLSFLDSGQADGTAFAAVFWLALALLKMFSSRLGFLRELKSGLPGVIFGCVSALARGALNLSMVLLLAVAWKRPLQELFARLSWQELFQELFAESRIAHFIVLAWSKIDLFGGLYGPFGINWL